MKEIIKNVICSMILPMIILFGLGMLLYFIARKPDSINKYLSVIKHENYLAHALGGIDKHDYTNSLDALENSYKSGMRLFEVDLKFTSDNKLVCIHSWSEEDYKNILGLEYNEEHSVLTHEEFMNSKIQGKYTTLDIDEFISFMKKHNDMYVMIDIGRKSKKFTKKVYKEIVRAANNDSKVLNRLITGGQNTAMIEAVKEVYDFPIINLYWSYKNNRKDKKIDTKEEFLNYCKKNNITSLSTSEKAYNENKKAIKYFRDNGLKVIYLQLMIRKKQKNT